jgi:membrane-associated phospholipid phosphatase
VSKKNAIYIFSVVYFITITLILFYHKSWFFADQVILAAFILTIFIGRAKQFLFDWVPFIILLLSYEYLRSIAPLFWKSIYITPLITADLKIFGFLPTHKLQALFFHPQKIAWYDYLAVFLYVSHFVVPLLIGYIFWLKNRKIYKQFIFSLLLLSYFAFITYLLYPAMPPWLAAEEGHIAPVYKIMGYVFYQLGPQWRLTTIFESLNPNVNAAMPSLHAAYPFLIFLYLLTINKKASLLFFFYMIGVWFSLVYLGEHYVIDIIVGIIYALASFFILKALFNKPYLKKRNFSF